jgi:hypothetical protein
LHKREAATVKALKLERIWEPSPFPVELPASERSKSAEPPFLPTPWIPSPPGLWQELPTQPGEVRFAKRRLRRDGGLILSAALTREEAEERHREREDYVLTVRLPDGLLLMIMYSWHWDRNLPKGSHYLSGPTHSTSYLLELHGASFLAMVHASDWRHPGVVELSSIWIHERFTFWTAWNVNINTTEDRKSIHDSRSGETIYKRSTLEPAERELAMCAIPAFGEYAEFEVRIRALLQQFGYGVFT